MAGEDAGAVIDPAAVRPPRRRWVTVVGVAVSVIVVGVAVFASGIVYWANAPCNPTPVELSDARGALRSEAPLPWLAAAAVVAGWAVVVRAMHRPARWWLVAAGALATVAGREALFAQPQTWCLF